MNQELVLVARATNAINRPSGETVLLIGSNTPLPLAAGFPISAGVAVRFRATRKRSSSGGGAPRKYAMAGHARPAASANGAATATYFSQPRRSSPAAPAAAWP